jgi:hypothetical protein
MPVARWIVLRFQAGVLAEGMACGLVVGQLWDSRIVLRGVSMPRGILSRHFMKDLFLHACASGSLFFSSSKVLERVEVWL